MMLKFLDEQEFYEVMEAYRQTDPDHAYDAFKELKQFLRRAVAADFEGLAREIRGERAKEGPHCARCGDPIPYGGYPSELFDGRICHPCACRE